MTITIAPSRNEYTANAGQTIFNYTFKIFADTNLNVYITPAGAKADDSTDLTVAYVVDPSGINNEDGGFITLSTGVNQNDLVTIVSDVPSSRTVDYQNNGDFRPDVVNADFDRVVSIAKKLEDTVNRTVVLPQSQQGPKPLSLPNPEPGKAMVWKGDRSGLANVNLAGEGYVEIPGSYKNYITNPQFTIPSPDDSQPPPDSTPRDYAPGFQIYTGWFAGALGADQITIDNGVINATGSDQGTGKGGSIYTDVPKSAGLKSLSQFISSVADTSLVADTNGVDFDDMGTYFRVTIDLSVVSNLFSAKFETGSTATLHEVVSAPNRYSFPTIADIKGVAIGDYVSVEDYATGNNSGVLFFRVVAAGTAAVDGGKYIDLAGIGQLRQNLKIIPHAKDWGCVGNGVTDDHTQAQAGLDYCIANQTGKYMFNPGTYLLSSPLVITGVGDDMCICGPHWRGGAILKGGDLNQNVVEISAVGGSQSAVRDIQIQGKSRGGGTGRGIQCNDAQSINIDNVWISTMPSYGIGFANCSDVYTRRLTIEFTNGGIRGDGFTFSDIEAAVYSSSAKSVFLTGMQRSTVNITAVDGNQEGLDVDDGALVSADNNINVTVRGTVSGSGVAIKGARTSLSGTIINSSKNGLFINDSDEINVDSLTVVNSNIAESGFNGVAITNTRKSNLSNITTSDDQVAPTQVNGIHINGSANEDISISNYQGVGNTGDLLLDTGTRTTIDGVTRATTSQFSDANDEINVYKKYKGRDAVNTTTGRRIYSDGNGALSNWLFMDGSIAHTPV